MKIWCLFSIANDYSQPSNNLECFWVNRPTLIDLYIWYNNGTRKTEEVTNLLERIVNGKRVRMMDSDYRIQEVKQGEKLI